MKSYKTIEEAEKDLKSLSNGFSGDTIFMAKYFPLYLKLLRDVSENTKKLGIKEKSLNINNKISQVYHDFGRDYALYELAIDEPLPEIILVKKDDEVTTFYKVKK